MNLLRKSCLTLSTIALAVALAPAGEARSASAPPAEVEAALHASHPNLDPDGDFAPEAD